MISVIISTYNRRKQLKRAIQSVLNQSYKDFELIVVDDCSTDGTEEMLKKFPQVEYFKTKRNSGHDGLPKNIGIQKAKGDYICFLDDDDIWRRDALKVLSKYIEYSKADIVYADYLIDRKPGWSIHFSASLLSKQNYITMDTVIVRRKCLLEVGGFNEEIPRFKDWNLWLRLQKRGYKFLHIPIIITEVQIGKETISEKYKVDRDEQGSFLPTFFNPADCKIYADKTILGEQKPLKVALFTLTMNRLKLTKEMYKSLETAGYDFDWFVVDQASQDGTKKWLKGKAIVKYNRQNEGIAKGWNQAIELIKKTGKYDIVCKVDNDALLMTDGWLKMMVDLFERNRKIILSPYVEGLEDSPGGVLRQRSGGESPYVMINERVLGVAPHLGGIVFGSPIELYDNFKFPEDLKGNKDYFLSRYALQRGWTLFYMEEARVFHNGQEEQVKDYK